MSRIEHAYDFSVSRMIKILEGDIDVYEDDLNEAALELKKMHEYRYDLRNKLTELTKLSDDLKDFVAEGKDGVK